MFTARFFQLFTGICATAVSCHPQPANPKVERVVLVHGIFEDGKAFDSLKIFLLGSRQKPLIQRDSASAHASHQSGTR
jgi:hypothetical protein